MKRPKCCCGHRLNSAACKRVHKQWAEATAAYKRENEDLRRRYPDYADLDDTSLRIAVATEISKPVREKAERLARERRRTDHLAFLKKLGMAPNVSSIHLKLSESPRLHELSPDEIIALGMFPEYFIRLDTGRMDSNFRALMVKGALDVSSSLKDGPKVRLTPDAVIMRRDLRRNYHIRRVGNY